MMSLSSPTRRALRHDPNRSAASAAALLLGCALTVVLTFGASRVSAQTSSTRSVCFTVTDAQGRFVTGLEQQHFEVSENGERREITAFSDAYSPITLAIVSQEPLPPIAARGAAEELIQTTSLSDALQQLAASTSLRKGIVGVAGIDVQAIPYGIPALHAGPAELSRAVLTLREQYCLGVEPSTPSARVEVSVDKLRGLPPLHLNWLNW